MKRNMTAIVMTLAMSTVMTAMVLSGCSGTSKETVPEIAKEQRTEVRTMDTTGESGGDEENSAGAASGSYEDEAVEFVGMTLNSKYHTTLVNGIKVEAGAENVRIEVRTGDQYASTDVQLGAIEDMIVNKVDRILLALSSSNGLKSVLTKCKEAGISITNLDTKLTDESFASVGLDVPFYGTNNYEGAKLAGEYVAKNSEKGIKTAILKGIEGQTNTADRYNGSIEGAGDTVTVVAERTANWGVDQGYIATQNIISANPDVELSFCCNDNMGIGALRAIKGVNTQEQIQIIGFDAASEVLDLVENGELLATVAQYPAKMGKLGVGDMLKIFGNGEAGSYTDTGTEVITKDNVGEFKDYLKTFGQGQGQSLTKNFSYGIRTCPGP